MRGLDPAARLRARAELLARPPDEPESGAARDLVIVAVDGRRFGVDVDRVQSILRNPGLCRLPGSCGALVGLASAQDAVVPVADLAAVLGGSSDMDRPFLVLLRGSEPTVGFLVDGAEGVIRAPERDVLSPDGDMVAGGAERAVTRDGVVVLDADHLLSDPRLTTHQEAASTSSLSPEETHATHVGR